MSDAVSVLIAGDYHVYGSFDQAISAGRKSLRFGETIEQIVRASDFSIVNLEDPVSDRQLRRCRRSGVHGVGRPEALEPLEAVGFNVATLATNHMRDTMDAGVWDTIQACKRFGLRHVGAGMTLDEARAPLVLSKESAHVAVLNFSRIEFNDARVNRAGANPLDAVTNARDIARARKNADYVVVIVHDGVDVFDLPYPKLVDQMRFYVEMGADAVVLHHARRYSGVEWYQGRPIVYGLGNLVHNSNQALERRGLLARLTFGREGTELDLLPVRFDPEAFMVELVEADEQEETLRLVEDLTLLISDAQRLDDAWKKQIDERRIAYLSGVLGWPRIVPRMARHLGMEAVLLYLFRRKAKQLLYIKNVAICQSHREAMKRLVEDLIE